MTECPLCGYTDCGFKVDYVCHEVKLGQLEHSRNYPKPLSTATKDLIALGLLWLSGILVAVWALWKLRGVLF